jgi:hypothetical protein
VVNQSANVWHRYPRRKESVASAKRLVEKKTGMAALTERQKTIFDSYVQTRSLDKTAKELELNVGDVWRVHRSPAFQNALKEYNKELLDVVDYNAAVIIDELWKLYGQEATGAKEKVNILTLLGKHIGMWATKAPTADDGKPSIQYNIVNYHGIVNEIERNEKEVRPLIESNDAPQGFEVLSYGD